MIRRLARFWCRRNGHAIDRSLRCFTCIRCGYVERMEATGD